MILSDKLLITFNSIFFINLCWVVYRDLRMFNSKDDYLKSIEKNQQVINHYHFLIKDLQESVSKIENKYNNKNY